MLGIVFRQCNLSFALHFHLMIIGRYIDMPRQQDSPVCCDMDGQAR